MNNYLVLQITKLKVTFKQAVDKFPQHEEFIVDELTKQGKEDLIVR